LFWFQPAESIQVARATDLFLNLSVTPPVELTLSITPWNPQTAGWGILSNFDIGRNIVPHPNEYVLANGDVFIAIRNYGTAPITFDNITITVIVETVNGEVTAYGEHQVQP
jgi:hypothetical protein